jgi:hypothetical protein
MAVPAVAHVVAATTPSADSVSPGIVGFLVIFALALATVVLIRSMVGHLRKVRYSPGPDGTPGEASAQPSVSPTAPVAPTPPVAATGTASTKGTSGGKSAKGTPSMKGTKGTTGGKSAKGTRRPSR